MTCPSIARWPGTQASSVPWHIISLARLREMTLRSLRALFGSMKLFDYICSVTRSRMWALARVLGNGPRPEWGTTPAGVIVILAVLFDSAVPVVSEYGDARAGKIIINPTRRQLRLNSPPHPARAPVSAEGFPPAPSGTAAVGMALSTRTAAMAAAVARVSVLRTRLRAEAPSSSNARLSKKLT
jgi:hypothetical protein